MSYADALVRDNDMSSAEGDAARAPRRPTLQNLSPVTDRDRKNSILFVPPMVSVAIKCPERTFRMRGTFIVDTKYLDDGTYFVRHRELPVYGYGESMAEAMSGFCEMFDLQWRALVEGNEADLSEDARAAREQFRAAVEAVIAR